MNVRAGWRPRSSEELEAILRLEFPDEVIDELVAGRQPSDRISYGVALFVILR